MHEATDQKQRAGHLGADVIRRQDGWVPERSGGKGIFLYARQDVFDIEVRVQALDGAGLARLSIGSRIDHAGWSAADDLPNLEAPL